MLVSFGFFYLGLIDKRNKKKDLSFLAYLTKEMKRKIPKSGSERSTGAVAGGVPAMAVGGPEVEQQGDFRSARQKCHHGEP